MLLAMQIADFEHRERIRAFNARAARGEFIRYADSQLESVRWIERLGKLGRAARHRFTRHRGGRLVIQPGADSV
jgi:hypothetical protein